MKVLISAYACEPGRGAEPGVGWNVVRKLSERHELWVMTRRKHRDAVLTCGEEWIGRVHWVFLDPPRWATFWKNRRRGLYPFYLLWQMTAWRRARELMKEVDFDVIHHLTFGQYWIPTPLSDLGVPFLFGPVGGGECTPPGFAEHFSTVGKLHELLRDGIREWLPVLPWARHRYQAAGWSFAATGATAEAMRNLGVTELSVLAQSAIGDGDELDRYLAAHDAQGPARPDGLHLVSACRLVHWKAVDLSIEAVGVAVKRGLPVTLTVLQDGPERPRLEALVTKLGLENRVRFAGVLPGLDEVFGEVAKADALIHPALHEAFGQSCLESLALGTPVICLDWCGPGMIVDETSGYRVKPDGRAKTIEGLADAMGACFADKRAGRTKRAGAAERARNAFGWAGLAAKIEAAYRKLADSRPG